MTKALSALPGVEKVVVDCKKSTVVVSVKKDGGTSEEDITKAIKAAGFGVKPKEGAKVG